MSLNRVQWLAVVGEGWVCGVQEGGWARGVTDDHRSMAHRA